MINQIKTHPKMFNLEFTIHVNNKWQCKVMASDFKQAKERLIQNYEASIIFTQYSNDDLEDIGCDEMQITNISEVNPCKGV